jgi:hypothetical protein
MKCYWEKSTFTLGDGDILHGHYSQHHQIIEIERRQGVHRGRKDKAFATLRQERAHMHVS